MAIMTLRASGAHAKLGAFTCLGLVSAVGLSWVAEAKPRQAAPIDYARAGSGSSSASTVASAPPAPNRAGAPASPARLQVGAPAPRVEFRYPDQPDVVYGAGTGPRRADPDAPPLAFKSPTEAIDAAEARAALQRAGFASGSPAFEVAAPVAVERAPAVSPGGLRPAVIATSPPVVAAAGYEETGTASWYGPGFHGRETANGEIFDQEQLTAAHPTLPLPSYVQVTNLQNGRNVVVRVNDRGPFVGGRIIDVSAAAANQLGMREAGQAQVKVTYMGVAPPLSGSALRQPSQALPVPAVAESGPRRLTVPTTAPPLTQAAAIPRSLQTPDARPTVPEVPAIQPRVQLAETGPTRSVTTTGGSAGVGGYVIQAGSFVEVDNANRLRERIRSTGQAVEIQMATVRGSQVFRVVVGPWPTKSAAEAARERLAGQGFADTLVRSNL